MGRMNLLDFEVLLNTYSGNRYHIRQDDVATLGQERFSLYHIIKFGEEQLVIGGQSGTQMISYLQSHVKVVLMEDKNEKKN